jgi:hypothetical protein
MKFQRGAKKYSGGPQLKELDERKQLHHFSPKTSGYGQRYYMGPARSVPESISTWALN